MSFQSYPASQVGQSGFVPSGVYNNQQQINGNHGAVQQQYIIEQQENVDPMANSGWNQNQQVVVHYAHNRNDRHQFDDVSNANLGRSEWIAYNQDQQPGVVYLIPMDNFANSDFVVHNNLPNGQPLEIQQNLPSTRSTRRGKMAQFGDLDYVSELAGFRVHPVTSNRQLTNQTSPPFDIYLSDQQHWRQFHEQTNEMMLVNQGRNIFPQIGYMFNRMDPTAEYILGIKLKLRSPNKFEYDNGLWQEGNSVASADSNELFSIPLSGSVLMKDGFAFKDLKIFNIGDERKKGKNSKMGMQDDQLEAARQEDLERARRMLLVVLRCKYTPRLTVYQVDQWGQMHPVHTASFEETSFIVCTKYKSKIIRDMKSMANKFVRADAKRKCDQPLRSTYQTEPHFDPQEIMIENRFAPVPVTQTITNYPPPNIVPYHSTAPPPIVPSPPVSSSMNAPSTSSGNNPANSVDSLNPFPPLHSNQPMIASTVGNHCAPLTSSSHCSPNFTDSPNPSPPLDSSSLHCAPLTSSTHSPPDSADSLNPSPPLHQTPPMETSDVGNPCDPSTSSSNSPPNSVGSLLDGWDILLNNPPADDDQIELNNYGVDIDYERSDDETENVEDDDDERWFKPIYKKKRQQY